MICVGILIWMGISFPTSNRIEGWRDTAVFVGFTLTQKLAPIQNFGPVQEGFEGAGLQPTHAGVSPESHQPQTLRRGRHPQDAVFQGDPLPSLFCQTKDRGDQIARRLCAPRNQTRQSIRRHSVNSRGCLVR